MPFHYYGIGRWSDGNLEIVENLTDQDAARRRSTATWTRTESARGAATEP